MGNPRDEVRSVGGPHLGPDDAGDTYDSVIDALHAAGFRIIGKDEVDQVTVEKAAEAAYEMITDGEHAEEVSAAVRALATSGGTIEP